MDFCGALGMTESNLGQLTLGLDHTDPNRFALTFRVLRPRLLSRFLLLEGLRQTAA